MRRKTAIAFLAAVSLLGSGCAYRVDSNVQPDTGGAEVYYPVIVTEDMVVPGHQLEVLEKLEVSVKKLTVFHADPTKEQANDALKERARALKADAVVGVKYKSGIGAFTWGYIDAEGMAVKFAE